MEGSRPAARFSTGWPNASWPNPSAGIAVVGTGTVTDSGNTDRFPAIDQLVENSICANPQRVQPAELSSKRIPGKRVALEQTECLLDRVDQRPTQLEQVAPSSPGED